MISREETGRKKVLKITGGYHGAKWLDARQRKCGHNRF